MVMATAKNCSAKLLRANRGKTLYTATKVPPKNRKWPSRAEFTLDDCYPPEYIEEYVDKSLTNIGVPTLDLIQLHTWEDAWLEDDRLPLVLQKVVANGKVRAVGISSNRWEPNNGVKAVRAGTFRCCAGDLQHFRSES